MKNLLRYICLPLILLPFSCSEEMLVEEGGEQAVTETYFRTDISAGFADVYEDAFATRAVVPASELLQEVQYIIYNTATGEVAKETKLTDDEMNNGFRVDLSPGSYRICLIGKGRIENYPPLGVRPPVEIQPSPTYGGIWVASNQSGRYPVYNDYYFANLEFTAGTSGARVLSLKRVTGMVQLEVVRMAPDISINEISVGYPKDRMYNNFHTDGSYSCSKQVTEPVEPYGIYHSMNRNAVNGFYEGVYFPTKEGAEECVFTISYRQGGRLRTMHIRTNNLRVEANKRTRLPVVLEPGIILKLSANIEAMTSGSGTRSVAFLPEGQTIYTWADEVGGGSHLKAWMLTAGTTNTLNGNTQYFPSGDRGVDIYALHGNFDMTFREGTTDFPATLVHTTATDQSTDAGYAKSDLLYAIRKNVLPEGSIDGQKTEQLTFYHLLSKVEVNLLPGTGLRDGDLDNATVTLLNTRLKADFVPQKDVDMAVGTERAGMVGQSMSDNAPASVIMRTRMTSGLEPGTVHAEAVIVPQTIGTADDSRFVRVRLATGTDLYASWSKQAFESGKKYVFNITVNLSGSLQVTPNIEDWVDGNTDEGNAEME